MYVQLLLRCSWKLRKSRSAHLTSIIFEDAIVILGVISFCFLGFCSTISNISILFLFVVSLPYKTHISINLKRNPWVLDPVLFKLHLDFGQLFFLSSISSIVNFQVVSLLSLQILFLPPFLPLSIPSLSFSFLPFLLPSWFVYIEYLLCAEHNTKGLGLSHSIKSVQNTHTYKQTHTHMHTPFLDLRLSFGYHLISLFLFPCIVCYMFYSSTFFFFSFFWGVNFFLSSLIF